MSDKISELELQSMEIGEIKMLECGNFDHSILRVPGGWAFTTVRTSGENEVICMSSCFVPDGKNKISYVQLAFILSCLSQTEVGEMEIKK